MNQLMDWIAMGGYSFYIWPAYGLVCVVLLINLLGIKWQKKRTRELLQQWFKRQSL
jgi:heme exporter protein D